VPSISPPLILRWTYAGAVWSADPGPDVILTQREGPWALAALSREGRELWRLPGRFNWIRTEDGIVAVRYQAQGRKSEIATCVVIDARTGSVLEEQRSKFGWRGACPGRQSFIGDRLDSSSIACVSLKPEQVVRWEHVLPRGAEDEPRVVCNQGRVFCAFGGEIVAFDEQTGREIWRASPRNSDELAKHLEWNLDAVGDSIITSTDNGTAAFDARTGGVLWFQKHRGPRAGYGGRLYISGRSWKGAERRTVMWAVDVASGELVSQWDLTAPVTKASEENRLTSRPAVSEAHVFCGDEIGTLWAFDRGNGKVVWQHRPKGTTGYISGTDPVIDGHRLYVTSYSMDAKHPAQLYVYEQEDAPAEDDAGDEPDEGVQAEFVIERVLRHQALVRRVPYLAADGDWLVLQCRWADATFFLGIRPEAKVKGKLAPAESALWVVDTGEGERLLAVLHRWLGTRPVKGKRALRPQPPTRLEASVLGEENGWTKTKWTGSDGSPELYVNWSLKEKRGRIAEKDDAYRKDLIALFASLVARS
jgi:hypothetical protein